MESEMLEAVLFLACIMIIGIAIYVILKKMFIVTVMFLSPTLPEEDDIKTANTYTHPQLNIDWVAESRVVPRHTNTQRRTLELTPRINRSHTHRNDTGYYDNHCRYGLADFVEDVVTEVAVHEVAETIIESFASECDDSGCGGDFGCDGGCD